MEKIKQLLAGLKKYKVLITIFSTIIGGKIYRLSNDIISNVLDPILFFDIKNSDSYLKKKISNIVKIFLVFLLIFLLNFVILKLYV